MYRNIKYELTTGELRFTDKNLMPNSSNMGETPLNQFIENKAQNRCFLQEKIQQISKRKNVMKMKQKNRELVQMANMNRQKERNLLFLETDVLFQVKTVENSKKYMQTVQPFLPDVGYNILGEGQLFIDETAGYAYNIKGLPLLVINWLLNRVDSEISIQEGEAICHH